MTAKTGGHKICTICSNEYYVSGYRFENSKFCSRQCWNGRNPPVLKTCIICRCSYSTYNKQQSYCSFKCRNKAYIETHKGSKSHFWKGGKTKLNKLLRSSTKFKQWREAVFERDYYTCQDCGAKSIKGHRVEIHPHHIRYLSEFPELAYDVDNGKTLCKDCHWIEHKKDKTKTREVLND